MEWKSPQLQLQRILISEPNLDKPAVRQFQHYHTYEDGTQAGLEVDYILSQKPIRPNANVETFWKGVDSLTKAGQRVDAFLKAVDKLDTLTEAAKTIDILMRAAEKCGIPKTKADLLAKDGQIENALKIALTRHAVKTALFNGVWQNATLTAVFDMKRQ